MSYTQIWDAAANKVSDKMIRRDRDGAFIPFDDANVDYQDYKQWLKQGNRPKSAQQERSKR